MTCCQQELVSALVRSINMDQTKATKATKFGEKVDEADKPFTGRTALPLYKYEAKVLKKMGGKARAL